MKIHPAQFASALSHIKTAWPKGCDCKLCRAVDAQENITVDAKATAPAKGAYANA